MENQNKTPINVIDYEQFGENKRQYFLDIRKTKNQRLYLQISNRFQCSESKYNRSRVILFEEDLPFFVEAMTMLLSRYATGNLGISC